MSVALLILVSRPGCEQFQDSLCVIAMVNPLLHRSIPEVYRPLDLVSMLLSDFTMSFHLDRAVKRCFLISSSQNMGRKIALALTALRMLVPVSGPTLDGLDQSCGFHQRES